MSEEPTSILDRLKGWLSLSEVFALIFYAVLRLAYLQFYVPFGLRPEDVGIGKTELLTQAHLAAQRGFWQTSIHPLMDAMTQTLP